MAIGNERRLSDINYRNGYSTDVKPTSANDGDQFKELDTGYIYEYNKGDWVLDKPDFDYTDYIDTLLKGTATGGTDTTLVDDTKNFEVDVFNDNMIKIVVDGVEYYRTITDTTSDTITFATIGAPVAGTAILGTHEAGEVTILTVEKSADVNDYTVEVVEGTVENENMSASFADNVLTVTLGMGVGDKATATIGTGANGTVVVEVDEAGADGNDYTITVNTTETEDANLSAILNVSDISITLGNDLTEVSTTKNTAALIAQAINLIEGFTATASGTGEDSIIEAIAQTSFTGGGLNPSVDGVKNTATAIAEAIDDLEGFTATMTGSGGVLAVTVEPIAFTGGYEGISVGDGDRYQIIRNS